MSAFVSSMLFSVKTFVPSAKSLVPMNSPSLPCRKAKPKKKNAIALQHTSSRFLKSVFLVLRIETARVKGGGQT